jgi:hypothetical protein
MKKKVRLCADPKVPNEGWVCIDFSSHTELSDPCGWCGVHRLQRVHTMAHPDWPGVVRVGVMCAAEMGDTEARVRERRFNANPEKARTLLEIEIQLRRELSTEVLEYLVVAHKRLKHCHAPKTGGKQRPKLDAEDAAVLAEVLQGLKDGRSVEHVIDRWHASIREEYVGHGIPAVFGLA